MRYPNKRQEKKLHRHGYKLIVGIDEAGKGSWAGPIVAGAVILNPDIKIKGIKDSKLLRRPDRERLFKEITASAIGWSVGVVSNQSIDRLGITEANKLAMTRALKKLVPQPDCLLIDAVVLEYNNIKTIPIIDGDHKVTSIAAASIIAKVSRDALMDEFDESFPQWGFKQHKGYGTAHHFHMINEHGICDLHRKSFRPIKDFLN
ncbi:MAG: ribonuclease HII [Candidatus Buchananbacteria bacterium]|nr:ribonuclease HII [Candidatus Buchananbacteria bacterium]